jgi:NAD-reducing hydrogenase small subunit
VSDTTTATDGGAGAARRPRLATAWLGSCSGCHMSFLDLDEWLFDLAGMADVVFSPLADIKEFPPDVDVTLVEGAIANEDNLELALAIRRNSRIVVSFGDCAVTGNVTALRNRNGSPEALLQRIYADQVDIAAIPDQVVPALLPEVKALHEVIGIDVYLPGCPPSAEEIKAALVAVLDAAAANGGTGGIEPGGYRPEGLSFG